MELRATVVKATNLKSAVKSSNPDEVDSGRVWLAVVKQGNEIVRTSNVPQKRTPAKISALEMLVRMQKQ